MEVDRFIFTLIDKFTGKYHIKYKQKNCGLINLALGFPECVNLIRMCGTCFVLPLKASGFFVVVCQQALHRDLQNITQQVNCLLPFVPLRKLTEILNGETILRDVSLYRDIHWSPQQVHILL